MSAKLADSFDKVVVFDNLHPQVHVSRSRPSDLDARAHLVMGDVTSPSDWDLLLTDWKPSVVVHLAAETGTGQSLSEASRHGRVNVVGTTEMLDAFVRHDRVPSRMVLASSRAVYGEGAWQNRVTGEITYPGQRSRDMLERGQWDFADMRPQAFRADHTRVGPTSVYGATKLCQEELMSIWAKSFDVELAIFRFQNVYGPGQSLINSYTGIVSLFAQLAKAGKSLPLYEDGMIIRDFVYIEDVSRILTIAALNGKSRRRAYDVGSGHASSLLEVAESLCRHYGAPAPYICAKYRLGDVRAASCDISQARADFSWEPLVKIDEGLKLLCHWIDRRAA